MKMKKKISEAISVLHDEKKANDLLEKLSKLCDKLSNLPYVGRFFADIPLACSLFEDYVNGKYKEIPLASIITIVIALIYLVSPIDLIPESVPFIGKLDDMAIIGIVLTAVHNDLATYARWKQEQ